MEQPVPSTFLPSPAFHPDYAVTWVTCEKRGDVHVFLPDYYDWTVVKDITANFSRRICQPVKVYHDKTRKKFRLCPIPANSAIDTTSYGILVLCCDASGPTQTNAIESEGPDTGSDSDKYIPRPPNSWILYRQAKSRELSQEFPGITASELSTMIARMWHTAPAEIREHWQEKAKEQDRLHKEMYPDYKYMARKPKKNKGSD